MIMTSILTKVVIKHIQGNELASIYENDSFSDIILPQEGQNNPYLNIENEFMVHGEKYKIVKIRSKFFNQMKEVPNKGMSMNVNGKQQPYNFQITYEVDNV